MKSQHSEAGVEPRKKARQSSKPAKKAFPFMNLPAELRNSIYELVAESATTHIRLGKGNKPKFACTSALMLVSKQFNREVTSMFDGVSSINVNIKIKNFKFSWLKAFVEKMPQEQFEKFCECQLTVHLDFSERLWEVNLDTMQSAMEAWLSYREASARGISLNVNYIAPEARISNPEKHWRRVAHDVREIMSALVYDEAEDSDSDDDGILGRVEDRGRILDAIKVHGSDDGFDEELECDSESDLESDMESDLDDLDD